MTRAEFRNALCVLHSLDARELRGVPADWARAFMDDPARQYLRADDAMVTALWQALQRRIGSPATEPALKPCPFCGGGADYIEFDDPDQDAENFGGTIIVCEGCGCSTEIRFSIKEDARPLLAEAWNKREPDAAAEARGAERMREAAALRLEARADNIERQARGGLGGMFSAQSATDLRSEAAIIRALPDPASHPGTDTSARGCDRG